MQRFGGEALGAFCRWVSTWTAVARQTERGGIRPSLAARHTPKMQSWLSFTVWTFFPFPSRCSTSRSKQMRI